MRRTPNPAISTQMYRHFATITVAVTALVAFLANGEESSATVTPVHVAKVATKAKESAVEASERAVSVDPGSWGSGNDADFGKPTTAASGSGSWFANQFASAGSELGASPAQQAPEGNDDPADDSAKQPTSAPAPTAAQISAAMTASRLRSGSAGRD